MRRFNRILVCFCLVVSSMAVATLYNGNSAIVSAAEDPAVIEGEKKIKEVFPDAKFAKKVADALGKSSVEDLVTQDDLDGLPSFVSVIGNTGLESIEGVQYLRNLKNFLLYGSDITTVPEAMGNLTQLTSLQLNANKLTEVPKFVENLVNLEKLTFFQNDIVTCDVDLSNLTKLKEFSIYQNKLTSFTTLLPNSVEKLELQDNEISELGDNILPTSLEELNISSNKLKSIPLGINDLDKLTRLEINNNQIQNEVPLIALKPHALGSDKLNEQKLRNHTQTVKHDDITIYANQSINSDMVLNDLLRQIDTEAKREGKSLANFGKWQIKEVGKYSGTTINYVDGSEINDSLFTRGKSYTVEFYTTNRSYREWGSSSFTTTVHFSNETQSKVIVAFEDEDGNILGEEVLANSVDSVSSMSVPKTLEIDGDIYKLSETQTETLSEVDDLFMNLDVTHENSDKRVVVTYDKKIKSTITITAVDEKGNEIFTQQHEAFVGDNINIDVDKTYSKDGKTYTFDKVEGAIVKTASTFLLQPFSLDKVTLVATCSSATQNIKVTYKENVISKPSTDTNKTSNNVKTSDTTNLAVLLTLLCISGAVLVIKKTKEN